MARVSASVKGVGSTTVKVTSATGVGVGEETEGTGGTSVGVEPRGNPISENVQAKLENRKVLIKMITTNRRNK